MQFLSDILRACLLTAHLITGAVAGMGPLLVALLRLSPRLRTTCDDSLRRLAGWSFMAMLASLAIGAMAAAWLCWPAASSYREAALRIPASAYQMLAGEWVFTFLLLAVYLVLWRRLSNLAWLHGLIALVASTNLLYHFPTMMLVIGALADQPGFAAESEITRPVFLRLITTPELLAKTVHFWSLSLLVAGTAASLSAARETVVQDERLIQAGGVAALLGLAMVLVSGVVALTQLPALPQRALIGGDLGATTAFGAALLVALGLAHTLLPIATGDSHATTIRRAGILVTVAVLLMAYASGRVASL